MNYLRYLEDGMLQRDREIARLEAAVAASEAGAHSLRAQVSELFRQLADADETSRALQNGLNLDVAMSAESGALKLDGETATCRIWEHVSFDALRRERERRVHMEHSLARENDQNEQRLRDEFLSTINEQAAALEEERKAHAAATTELRALREAMDRITLGDNPMELLGNQQHLVMGVISSARAEMNRTDLPPDAFDFSAWRVSDLLEPLRLHALVGEVVTSVLASEKEEEALRSGKGLRTLLRCRASPSPDPDPSPRRRRRRRYAPALTMPHPPPGTSATEGRLTRSVRSFRRPHSLRSSPR
jgi:hypothetical protein